MLITVIRNNFNALKLSLGTFFFCRVVIVIFCPINKIKIMVFKDGNNGKMSHKWNLTHRTQESRLCYNLDFFVIFENSMKFRQVFNSLETVERDISYMFVFFTWHKIKLTYSNNDPSAWRNPIISKKKRSGKTRENICCQLQRNPIHSIRKIFLMQILSLWEKSELI